jgi:hypothetical protein
VGIQGVGEKSTEKRRRSLEDSHVLGCLYVCCNVVAVGMKEREKKIRQRGEKARLNGPAPARRRFSGLAGCAMSHNPIPSRFICAKNEGPCSCSRKHVKPPFRSFGRRPWPRARLPLGHLGGVSTARRWSLPPRVAGRSKGRHASLRRPHKTPHDAAHIQLHTPAAVSCAVKPASEHQGGLLDTRTHTPATDSLAAGLPPARLAGSARAAQHTLLNPGSAIRRARITGRRHAS